MDLELEKMVQAHEANRSKVRESQYWAELNKKNIAQLEDLGYGNFKQTIALNYFTWLLGGRHPDRTFLIRNLPVHCVARAAVRTIFSRRHQLFTAKQSLLHNFMTFMLWEYTCRQGNRDILESLEEPLEGNAPSVQQGGREISQDLANSVLEFQTITEGVGGTERISSIIELGGGYGRTAYIFLRHLPHIRYVMIDIPPGLYISQRYLSSQFPDRKIFKFRDFQIFSQVEKEFLESEIAFILPSQLALLPDNTADLFLGIDSLHEMRPEQIDYYFDEIDRVTAGFFYIKCWQDTMIPYDDIRLREYDYPIRSHWKELLRRNCRVQTGFFEAVFAVN